MRNSWLQAHIVMIGKLNRTLAAMLCGSLVEANLLGFDDGLLATVVHRFFDGCALWSPCIQCDNERNLGFGSWMASIARRSKNGMHGPENIDTA